MPQFCRKSKRLFSAVTVYRLDRLSRQTQDYLTIRKQMIECQITLISASEPTGNSPTDLGVSVHFEPRYRSYLSINFGIH
jgi:DNA invertase Pin-like site-specific DNA recombinase